SIKQKTISNGGKVQTGTFSRGPQPNQHTPTVTEQNTNPAITGKNNLKLEAWADNWIKAYIGEQLLVEDSVTITTERS
ncbi:PEBP family protein, partial [Pseudoalteromonas aliena]